MLAEVGTAAELAIRGAGAPAPGAMAAEPPPPSAFEAEARVDLAAFIELLTSDPVCVWGECHNIRDRLQRDKARKEAEEYERNPPAWHFWKWEAFGGRRAA